MSKQVSPEKLARWRTDVCGWAEENVWIEHPGTGEVGPLKLGEHQRAWLKEATRRDSQGHFIYKVCVASWPKRETKTTSVALIAAWRLACFTRQDIGVIANSERQAQSNVFDAVESIFRESPNLQEYVPEDCFQTRKIEVPSLGNVIETFPANWRTIQGRAFDLLCADEVHACEDQGRCFVFASQQTEARDSQVLVSSQAGPPVSVNPMWRLYQAGERGEPGIFFDYRDTLTFPWVIARAQIAKAELLSGEYDYLWGNAWGATGIKLLAAADVQAAAMDYAEPQTADEWSRLCARWGFDKVPVSLGVGLDRAGVGMTGDRTVWTVTARFDLRDALPVFRVVMCEVMHTGSEQEVLTSAEKTYRIFGSPAQTFFEYYGCSDVVDKVAGAELITPTPKVQHAIFTLLHRLFQEHRIGFPAEAGVEHDPQRGDLPGLLKRELIGFEYDAQKARASGTVTRFGTQATHDDAIYAGALAIFAAEGGPPQVTTADFYQRPRYGPTPADEQAEALGFSRVAGPGSRHEKGEA